MTHLLLARLGLCGCLVATVLATASYLTGHLVLYVINCGLLLVLGCLTWVNYRAPEGKKE